MLVSQNCFASPYLDYTSVIGLCLLGYTSRSQVFWGIHPGHRKVVKVKESEVAQLCPTHRKVVAYKTLFD